MISYTYYISVMFRTLGIGALGILIPTSDVGDTRRKPGPPYYYPANLLGTRIGFPKAKEFTDMAPRKMV